MLLGILPTAFLLLKLSQDDFHVLQLPAVQEVLEDKVWYSRDIHVYGVNDAEI